MEEKQFRDKIYWLTFLFSLLVVCTLLMGSCLWGPRRLPLRLQG